MSDYYHFFGVKDKSNRFLMRLVNPFGFDILSAQIKLQELFSTHGVCPATNEVTWAPWKAGKALYQWWNVTPNKLGLIKSATPTLTLDAVNYKGLAIYLLSLDDYVTIYSNQNDFSSGFQDLDAVRITGNLTDFVQAGIMEFDSVNMAGIFINMSEATIAWATIKTWCESGNIFIDLRPYNADAILDVNAYIDSTIGSTVTCMVDENETEPIYNKPASITVAKDDVGCIYNEEPPVGWSTRTLVELFTYDSWHFIQEFTHDASGGKYIVTSLITQLPSWWYPIWMLQYSMMKYAGVSAYYME